MEIFHLVSWVYRHTMLVVALLLISLTPSLASDDDPSSGVPADPDESAWISGTIRYSGRVPKAPIANVEGFREPLLEVDPAARGLRYALVHLERLDGTDPEPKFDKAKIEALPLVKVDQVGFQFTPQVVVIHPWQTVLFGNGDVQNHNVRALSKNPRNIFNIITEPDHTYEKRFEAQDNKAPILLACDFHASMEGWIYVMNHDRHAVTNFGGTFEIGPITPGAYRLVVQQPKSRLRAEIEVNLKPGDRVAAETTFGLPHLYYQDSPPIQLQKLTTE